MDKENFSYNVEQFADLQLLRYRIDGFDELTLQQKRLVYCLTEAALWGRDILFDQNGRYNLRIRKMLEAIYTSFSGNRDDDEFKALEIYLKRVWFSNGIHHHYACDKFTPAFSEDYLRQLVKATPADLLPLNGQSTEEMLDELCPVIFDPEIMAKRVNQEDGQDLLTTSAENYYDGVTQQEAEDFYNDMKAKAANPDEPIMYGMNSQLCKVDGKLTEKVWKKGGMYGPEIEKIIEWLNRACQFCENGEQRKVIESLICFYETGSLEEFDRYSILWVGDTESRIDFVNGFIEVYGDPLGLKASWESIVNFKDMKATQRTETISKNAQWFENASPVDPRFKKEEVKGVTAKVITAVMLAGDLYPASAIGINLPNSNWIRSTHGSKSVTIGNLTHAYAEAAKNSGMRQEFVIGQEEIDLINRYSDITDDLHTDLHECLGHGSGRILPGIDPDALKAYGSTIEEARADLFGLYFLPDSKLVELGLTPDAEAYKAEYYTYMMNGLITQLVRIEEGRSIEEAHMRNRAIIARWALEKGAGDKVVEIVKREGKTFVRINDYEKLRGLFGELLAEVQRIKSEGDYEAARQLVENYGVSIDPELHHEVLERYRKLNLAPYKGFVNPVLTAETDADGNISDVTVDYTEGYAEQMLRYSRDYSL